MLLVFVLFLHFNGEFIVVGDIDLEIVLRETRSGDFDSEVLFVFNDVYSR